MGNFKCKSCGWCCVNTTQVIAPGRRVGIWLSPEESSHFPASSLQPLLIKNGVIKVYQLADDRCPNWTGSGCFIYEDRPLVCRAFPLTFNNGKLVLNVLCGSIRSDGTRLNPMSMSLELAAITTIERDRSGRDFDEVHFLEVIK